MFDKDKLKYITTLYVNSRDRQAGTNLNQAIYNIVGGLNGVDYLAVNSISFLNNVYDISGVFRYNFNSTDFTISFNGVDLGEYTAISLASFLQARIRAQTTSTTLTVVYNTVTNKLEFNTNNASVMFIYNNLTPIVRQIGMLYDDTDTTPQYPATAQIAFAMPYPVNLTGTQYIDICSNQLMQYNNIVRYTNNSANNSIYRLVNNYGFGVTLYQKEINLKYIKYDRYRDFSQFDISVYDDKNQLVTMNNSNYNIEIILYEQC
jgi:hypothetical protein